MKPATRFCVCLPRAAGVKLVLSCQLVQMLVVFAASAFHKDLETHAYLADWSLLGDKILVYLAEWSLLGIFIVMAACCAFHQDMVVLLRFYLCYMVLNNAVLLAAFSYVLMFSHTCHSSELSFISLNELHQSACHCGLSNLSSSLLLIGLALVLLYAVYIVWSYCEDLSEHRPDDAPELEKRSSDPRPRSRSSSVRKPCTPNTRSNSSVSNDPKSRYHTQSPTRHLPRSPRFSVTPREIPHVQQAPHRNQAVEACTTKDGKKYYSRSLQRQGSGSSREPAVSTHTPRDRKASKSTESDYPRYCYRTQSPLSVVRSSQDAPQPSQPMTLHHHQLIDPSTGWARTVNPSVLEQWLRPSSGPTSAAASSNEFRQGNHPGPSLEHVPPWSSGDKHDPPKSRTRTTSPSTLEQGLQPDDQTPSASPSEAFPIRKGADHVPPWSPGGSHDTSSLSVTLPQRIALPPNISVSLRSPFTLPSNLENHPNAIVHRAHGQQGQEVSTPHFSLRQALRHSSQGVHDPSVCTVCRALQERREERRQTVVGDISDMIATLKEFSRQTSERSDASNNAEGNPPQVPSTERSSSSNNHRGNPPPTEKCDY